MNAHHWVYPREFSSDFVERPAIDTRWMHCAFCQVPMNASSSEECTAPHEYAVLKPNDFSTFTHPLSRPEYAALKPDHGTSPAQLREKVEMLWERVDELRSRLDAALNRIDALEAQQSRWRGNKRPPAPIDSEDI